MEDSQKQQKTTQAINKIIEGYEAANDDRMGHLHNQFVGFISASKIPLPQVIVVLQILLNEAMDLAKSKYTGG